ncbi:MAG: hypothetical protein AB9900_10855 [Humidesulfovibrio sp.]
MSMCECDHDALSPEFFEERKHKARKAHKCSDCRNTIQPGEVYTLIACKYDGVFEAFKMCQGCEQVRGMFTCAPVGDLKRAVFEELSEGEGDLPLLDLGMAGAAKLQEFIDSWEERHGDGVACSYFLRPGSGLLTEAEISRRRRGV